MSTPAFRILADGADVSARVNDRLLSLTLTDQSGTRSDALQLALDDRDNALERPRKGAQLSVSLGYGAGLVAMGVFTVDEVSLSGPPDQITVAAHGADFRASLKAQRSYTWENQSLGQIVATIAQRHGYVPAVGEFLAEIDVPYLPQQDESDLHFLTRLARQYGATVKPVAGRLVLAERGAARTASGQALPPVTLTPAACARWTVTDAERGAYGRVVAQWRDLDAATTRQAIAGAGDPTFTVPGTFSTQAEAQRAADARKRALDRGTATLSLTTSGNPDILAETPLTLTGFRDGIAGAWTVTRATHTLNPSGYTTQVEAESAA